MGRRIGAPEGTRVSSGWMRKFAVVGAIAGSLMTISHARADEPELADGPRGTYVVQPEAPTMTVQQVQQQQAGPHILYLNRCQGGWTVSGGNNDSINNVSSIVQGVVNFPEYPFSDASWEQVMAESKELWAPFNITVTDVDPSPMPHDEAIVCGHGNLIGFGGAGGVAPYNCGIIPNAITFTFPEVLGDNPRLLAEVVGQEAAHAWGLDHEYKCEDPMTYLSGCGEKTFQNGDYACGEGSPRACQCGGNTQNSYQHILDSFGAAAPDTAAPTAGIVYPHDGESFDIGSDFDITVAVSDDVGVTGVKLFVDGEQATEDLSEPFGPWPVFDIPEGTVTLSIQATDASGKTTLSDTVTIYVEPVGAGDDGGDAGDGDDGGDAGDGGDDAADDGDDDGDGGDDDDDDGGTGGLDDWDGGGALPPGFGQNGEAAASCSVTPRGAPGMWLVLLPLLLLGVRPRSD